MIREVWAAVVQSTDAKVDVLVGTGAVSAWWWLPHFDNLMHVALGIFGLAIVILRLVKAYKDVRKN
jgi:hypothetical protein